MPDKIQPDQEMELLSGYVLNALSAAENADFERYLIQQPDLNQDILQLQDIMGLIAQSAPQASPSSHLRQNILSSILPASPTVQKRTASSWSWGHVAAWVGGILMVGLGLQNYLLLKKIVNLDTSAHEEQTTFSFTLKGTTISNANGQLLLDLETGRALLAFQNLPAISPNEVYTLWAITEKQNILCGTFTAPPSGQIVTQIAIPLDEYGSPIRSMQVFRGPAAIPADFNHSVSVLTSQL